LIPKLTFENIDRIMTKEVEVLKQYLVSKRTKLLFKQEESLLEYIEKPELLTFDQMKALICTKGASVISIIAKLNDT
jgi:hypothetical protein